MNRKPIGLTAEDVDARYNPEHVIQAPTTVYNRTLRKVKRYLITSAQNATPVEAGFWAVLKAMAGRLDAEILVVPLRYKNPTSSWSGSQQNAEHWDALVRPYLWNVRHALNKNLTLLADIKIQPTAGSPLTGAEGVSHASSGIIGHPKVQTVSVATPANRMAKLMMTTGSVTVANYTDSRAGRIGEFHHSLSALLVEVDGGKFYMRRQHWDEKSKSVTDLDVQHFADNWKPAPPALALVMGDTHVGFVDPGVEQATFGKKGLVQRLKPRHLVFHDLLDAYSVNPHHRGNPFNAVAKQQSGWDNVRREVRAAVDYVRTRTPKGCTPVVVSSNHDDMLARWVRGHEWQTDPVNAEFYLETALALVRTTKMGPGGTEVAAPFRWWLQAAGIPNLKALGGGESFVLGGVELGFHGDRGPNGARGSIKNMRRIGTKSIVGHSHSPGEDEGAVQVGTSTRLRLEYNGGGPSSWLNAHCVLLHNGKRQLVVIVDGKYTL